MKKLFIGVMLVTACSSRESTPLRADSAAGDISLETSPATPASGVHDSVIQRKPKP